MEKYYLCNDIRFIVGSGDGVTSPSAATHMKLSKATTFVQSHPMYQYYKIRSSSKGNDYVISTPMKFAGNDNNIVSTIKKAHIFSSPDEAYKYCDNLRSSLDPDISFVINENFKRIPRSSAAKKIDDDIKPLDLIEYEGSESSERIYLPKALKEELYKMQNGRCAICGKLMNKHSYDIDNKNGYTVDHIIPLKRGGNNRLENLRLTHYDCNHLKNDFIDKELLNVASNYMSNEIKMNPNSKYVARFFRSYIRGIINNNVKGE